MHKHKQTSEQIGFVSKGWVGKTGWLDDDQPNCVSFGNDIEAMWISCNVYYNQKKIGMPVQLKKIM